MRYTVLVFILCILSGCVHHSSTKNKNDDSSKENIFLADPAVLSYNGHYYVYGTRHSHKGILVYESTDLKNWEGPVGATNGFALRRGDVYSKGNSFMGANVFRRNNNFYMSYVIHQHLAVAVSQWATGPFTQKVKKPLNLKGKAIAPYVFIDDDGEKYLYYTKLDHGNKIYVVKLSNDLQSVDNSTDTECIHATEPWENTDKNPNTNWSITEGPAVLKHNGTYYLFYTANHYKNPDYNVGYATSSSPMGPWKKYKGNPILKHTSKVVGTGSCSFVRNSAGELLMFYHCHYSREKVSPRKTLYSKCKFVSAGKNKPDVFKVEDEKHFIYLKR